MNKKMLTIALAALLLLAVGLSAQRTTLVNTININPNPMDKYTQITITFNQPTNVGVNIETEAGDVIKTLYWGPADEVLQINWNRIGDDGSYTPSGHYILMVNHQARYTSTKKTIILK